MQLLNIKVKTVYLHLTHQCNIKCRYCYFDANHAWTNEVKPSELANLFEDVVDLAVQKIVFTGGEPLLRADLFDIAADFRKKDPAHKVRVCLMSNGMLITKDKAKEIAEVFDEVRVSLDGFENVNDNIRGEGTFSSALTAIRNLQEAKIDPAVSVTITKENIKGLEGFLNFLFQQKGVSKFHFSPFRPAGRGLRLTELTAPPQEARRAVNNFLKSHFPSAPGLLDNSKVIRQCKNCGVGNYLNIHPDGSVYPCHVLSLPTFLIGNIRKERLTKMLDAQILHRLRSLDFNELIQQGHIESDLSASAMCFGELYQGNPEYWSRLLFKNEE